MQKITNVKVVKGPRGKGYVFKLECGHEIRRTYSQGLPKTMTARCPRCNAPLVDKVFGFFGL